MTEFLLSVDMHLYTHISFLIAVHFPNISEFFERLARAVRTELRNVMTAISEGKLPQLFSQYVRRLEQRIVEQAKEKLEAIRDWVLKMVAHIGHDGDFQIFTSLLSECKDKVRIKFRSQIYPLDEKVSLRLL